MSSRIRVLLPLSACLLLLVAGCSGGNFLATPLTPSTGSARLNLAGKVRGGQQPVSGATIQLYEANTTTDQGASTPMLTTTVTTAGDGTFQITGDYTCPASNPFVYIVSTGGNPGLGGTVNNSDLTLMALLGTCSSLTSTTYVLLNELSTVTSVKALSSFISDAEHVGSAPSELVGIAGAFAEASDDLDFIGDSTDVDLPLLLLNTTADILAACVNSAGGVSGDGSPCGNLLLWTGGADTVTAAIEMTQSPGHNTSNLFGLITASAPFQPYLTSVPSDFNPVTGYTISPDVRAAALDSNGHIWLYTGGYSYNTVTNISTDTEGVITVYDSNFSQLFTVSPGTGGLYYPTSLASDASGHVFAMNANNTVSEFNSSGGAISPSGGWTTGFASGFTGTGTGNGYQADPTTEAGPIAVDAQGNIWVNGATNSLTACYAELNSSGTIITPASITAFCTSLDGEVDAATTDGSGNAWALSPVAIAKVNASGMSAATAPTSLGCFEPEIDVFSSGDYDAATYSIRYDHVNNQLWGISLAGAGAITDSATALFCDAPSASMPFVAQYASTSTTPGDPYSAGSVLISSAALDGAGNLWFTLGGVAASGTVGTVAQTFNGTVTYSTWLGELSPSGTLLSPLNTGTSTYGYQPAGLGANVTVTSSGGSVVTESASAELLGIDSSGNIWALDADTDRVLKITGMATANSVNY